MRDGAVEAVGEARAAERGIETVGQEARRAVHLDDGEQAARREAVVDAREEPGRVGDLVQHERRPHQICGRQRGPVRVEVGVHGADPVGQAVDERALGDPVEHRGARVDGVHLGPVEAPRERDRAGAGPRAQVDDDAAGGVAREAAHPGGELALVAVQDPGVEVEHAGERRVGGAVGVVHVGHASRLAHSCRRRIRSCP